MDEKYLENKFLWNHKRYKEKIEYLKDLNDILYEYIRDNKLIVYGGTAIDEVIKWKSMGKDKLYKGYVLADWDVLIPKFEEVANDIVKILSKNQYNKIRIVTGMTGKTRKIFVNLNSTAIIDITYISDLNYKKLIKNSILIDGVYYAYPQFLKIHQYQNLIFRLYSDHHRIKKSLEKIELLEKWFPINKSIKENKRSKSKKDIGRSMKELINKYEIIFGGDFVFYIYYPDNIPKKIEMIIYSNDYIPKHIPLIGRFRKSKIRILPIIGSTFYKTHTDPSGISYKICTKMCLLYEYYYLSFYDPNPKYIDKIKHLLNDTDTFRIYKSNTKDIPKIYNPENKYIREKIDSIPTKYIN